MEISLSLLSFLALSAGVTPLFAITAATPSDRRFRLPRLFGYLVASTSACSSQPAASMGFSLDYGSTRPLSQHIQRNGNRRERAAHSARQVLGIERCIRCYGCKRHSDRHQFRAACWRRAGEQHSDSARIGHGTATRVPLSATRSGSSSVVASTSHLSRSSQRILDELYRPGWREIYDTAFGADPKATNFV